LRRIAIIAVAAVVTGVVVGVVIARSDDYSSSEEVRAPELTVPGDSGSTSTSETQTGETTTGKTTTDDRAHEQEPGSSQGESGGAQAPSEDTERNDVAPPRDSPAERFERFCQQNPDAC
jgi:hypothetical protein